MCLNFVCFSRLLYRVFQNITDFYIFFDLISDGVIYWLGWFSLLILVHFKSTGSELVYRHNFTLIMIKSSTFKVVQSLKMFIQNLICFFSCYPGFSQHLNSFVSDQRNFSVCLYLHMPFKIKNKFNHLFVGYRCSCRCGSSVFVECGPEEKI